MSVLVLEAGADYRSAETLQAIRSLHWLDVLSAPRVLQRLTIGEPSRSKRFATVGIRILMPGTGR
jgi:hypothetical protein